MRTHPTLLRTVFLVAWPLLGTFQGALAHAGHEHGNGLASAIWLQVAGPILVVVLLASLIRRRPDGGGSAHSEQDEPDLE